MQNWEAMQTSAHYDQHNAWYGNMFAGTIKTEPGTLSPTTPHRLGLSPPLQTPVAAPHSVSSHLEHYLKQQMSIPMDTMTALTPSPSNIESNMQHFFDSNMQQQLLQQQQYQQQFQQAQQAAAQNQHAATHHNLPLGFNPLTPPGLPSAVLPSMSHFYQPNTMPMLGQHTPSPQPATSTALTPYLATPMEASEKLQSTLTPRNTPPIDTATPTAIATEKAASVTSSNEQQTEKDQDVLSNSSEDTKYLAESDEEIDDESIRLPIYNSHGKMKNYRCKTCGQIEITKVSFWEHNKSHMKPEKVLQCPKCPFVTELKHHLEYHTRKHKNIKPFQCDKCSYTCVNKSMLNSHRKSHSSIYQYRCSNCDYATKYCHSFKLHLRKYEHKPGTVLDEQGKPNPSIVIDVYGTRRGPKTKTAGAGGKAGKRANNEANAEMQLTSQLSAALQGFPLNSIAAAVAQQQQHQQQAQQQPQQQPQQQQQLQQKPQQHPQPSYESPVKNTAELPTQTPNIQLQQQDQQQNEPAHCMSAAPATAEHSNLPTLLSPLAAILQQNPNMASFFPYLNMNIQMLAAQHQAAVFTQLPPSMRESALQQLQMLQAADQANYSDSENDDDEADDADEDNKSIDSAMDLSRSTPIREQEVQQHETPEIAINLKVQEEHTDTPLISAASSLRRKGRVLDLETKSTPESPEEVKISKTESNPNDAASTPQPHLSTDELMKAIAATAKQTQLSPDELLKAIAATILHSTQAPAATANTSGRSSASSSGNSSNGSSNTTSNAVFIPAEHGAIYECKYCDIYFKDAVLYTIHMGYHSCDDVFKCNMCGEKTEGPVGLFVHMARSAHM